MRFLEFFAADRNSHSRRAPFRVTEESLIDAGAGNSLRKATACGSLRKATACGVAPPVHAGGWAPIRRGARATGGRVRRDCQWSGLGAVVRTSPARGLLTRQATRRPYREARLFKRLADRVERARLDREFTMSVRAGDLAIKFRSSLGENIDGRG